MFLVWPFPLQYSKGCPSCDTGQAETQQSGEQITISQQTLKLTLKLTSSAPHNTFRLALYWLVKVVVRDIYCTADIQPIVNTIFYLSITRATVFTRNIKD